MTFGRPSAIPEDYVRLHLPKPIEGDKENGIAVLFYSSTMYALLGGTSSTPAAVRFCMPNPLLTSQSRKLYSILWRIMASIYGHNVGYEDFSETELITTIIQLEQDMDQWQSLLPGELRLRTSATLPTKVNNSRVEKLRIVLTLRFLNTQLLLLRPVLTNLLQVRFKRDDGTRGEQRSIGNMQKNFTASCFRAAVELISIIHAVITRKELGKHLLGAWWFTLYYGIENR